MSAWVLRDENGLMKFKLSPSIAGKLMEKIAGKWQTKTFKSKGITSVYVFEEDMSFKIPDIDMQAFIWAGDYLKPEQS